MIKNCKINSEIRKIKRQSEKIPDNPNENWKKNLKI